MLIIAFIIPIPLVTIPRIIVFTTVENIIGFKLINTVIPQILMSVLGQGAYSTMLILIFYNFFNMIPKSLDEAAMIDGAGSLKVFYHMHVYRSSSLRVSKIPVSQVNKITGDRNQKIPVSPQYL